MAQPRVSDFPLSEDEFDDDARTSCSNADGKFVLEEDNGTEWDFDSKLKRWIQPASSRKREDLLLLHLWWSCFFLTETTRPGLVLRML